MPWALCFGGGIGVGEGRGIAEAYQSPLENSLALRLARAKRGPPADTAALRAMRVARREAACMLAGVRGGIP